MGILSWIMLGLIVGFLAGQFMKGGGYGLIGDIVLGIIGALVGGFLSSRLLGLDMNGFNIVSAIARMVSGNRARLSAVSPIYRGRRSGAVWLRAHATVLRGLLVALMVSLPLRPDGNHPPHRANQQRHQGRHEQ
jgi:uncharacterized membrane protein YeaQ/YmgE (transglycosylase-associated protein family)